MALFEWNSDFETGIVSIDTQHEKLVEYINRLHDGMMEGQATAALGIILDGLVAYTASHFKHEERIFDQIHWDNTSGHVEHHKKLVEQVVDFQQKFKSGDATISMELMDFLKDWLMNHILKEDMKYVDIMKQNKIS